MYKKQRRYPEAESAATAAYSGYVRSMGANHEFTIGTVELLVALYAEWSRPAKATEWRAKLPKHADPKQ
jgi:hypothetical protein